MKIKLLLTAILCISIENGHSQENSGYLCRNEQNSVISNFLSIAKEAEGIKQCEELRPQLKLENNVEYLCGPGGISTSTLYFYINSEPYWVPISLESEKIVCVFMVFLMGIIPNHADIYTPTWTPYYSGYEKWHHHYSIDGNRTFDSFMFSSDEFLFDPEYRPESHSERLKERHDRLVEQLTSKK